MKSKISKIDYDKMLNDPFEQSAVLLAMLALELGWDRMDAGDLGLAWEHIQKLHDDFDDDIWAALELALMNLRHIEPWQDVTNLWVHHPSYHYDEPPSDEFNEALFETLYARYKRLILNEVYDVEST